MAVCPHCGYQVPEFSPAPCPNCGKPTNAAPGSARPGGSKNSAVVWIVVGCVALFAVVAVLGIVAAIAIPNFVTASQRARQKRTVADIRSVGAAMDAFVTDKGAPYPEATTVSTLEPNLVPQYMASLPANDGWGTPLRYECWPAGACQNYGIASAGSDKIFEQESLQDYAPGTQARDFDDDIVFVNGSFVQVPESMTNR